MMPNNDHMTIDERYKYLRIMRPRYVEANRLDQGRLLDEMQAITGLHRKSLVRLLESTDLHRQPRQRQRGRTYDHHVDDALRVMAETLDYVCAERLQPALPWLAHNLAEHGELILTDALQAQLETISVSTVGRILARLGQDTPRLPRKRPSREASVTRDVPMGRIPWNELTPGHFETDLVHHSGPTTTGDYVHTLQMIDVATGWSERVAVFGRSQRAMEAGFRRIMARLPFPILEIHPDNGSEFFNHHLVRFFRDTVSGVKLSRSRPYHKNDNRFVEQKNHTLVRAFFGPDRFDTVAHERLLNQLYDQMWLYYNFFQPVLRLTEKQRRDDQGEVRYQRKWGEAQTPLDRLCATDVLDGAAKDRLTVLRDQTNPRQLRQEIYQRRDQVFALPLASCARDGWILT
jgi:transposase InsO family protein